MTLEHKTPKARREARSYCRRCLAVMLCCVLAFGLTVRVTPRAEATSAAAVTDVLAGVAGNTAGDALGSSLGLSALNAVPGISFLVDFGDKLPEQVNKKYQAMGYSLGKQLSDYLAARNDAVSEWWSGALYDLQMQGGISPGMNITIPADVASAIKYWAGENLNFADGVCTFGQAGIANADGSYFVLGEVDTSGISDWQEKRDNFLKVPLISMGTPLRQAAPTWARAEAGTYEFSSIAGQLTFTQRLTITKKENGLFFGEYVFAPNFIRGSLCNLGAGRPFSTSSILNRPSAADVISSVDEYISGNMSSTDFLVYSRVNNRIYQAVYLPSYGDKCSLFSKGFLDVSQYSDLLFDINTTLQAPADYAEPVTKDVAITIPQDVAIENIGGVSIPAYGDLGADTLTGEGTDNPAVPGAAPWDKVLAGLDGIGVQIGALPQDIAGAITDAWPITGTIAGDQTVEQAMSEPDSLGAVFITKFPFCIPWDIVQAIKLLAAPPTPPRFEFDMYSAMEGYGGFHSGTPVVIDFEPLEPAAAIVRWASMVGFIYCLAMGTKKLMWTA